MIHFAMEHPVPQNVTSFEFHLIGDMTLKQFGYLATGLIISYISFTLLLSVNVLLALPIILIASLTGIAFAFVPIYERPLDHWVLAFIKAIYSPTQGIWKANGQKGKISGNESLFQNRLQRYLATLGVATLPATATTIPTPVNNLPKMTRLTPPTSTSATPTPSPIPTNAQPPTQPAVSPPPPVPTSELPESKDLAQLVNMANEAHLLQSKIADAEKQIKLLQDAASEHQISRTEYTQKFQQASENLQNLVQETSKLYQQTAEASKQNILATPPPVTATTAQKAQVIVVEPQKEVKTQLTLTSLPNVINGVIFDGNDSYLEGVIVIIHNSEGLPVRALKTNKLGQFSGATPLPSGTYTLTMEKDGMEFDALQMTLSGEVIQPINIHPKRTDHAQQ